MKNFKFLFLFVLAGLISFSACKKDDDVEESKETINLGLIAPMQNYPEYVQDLIDAANLAINEINTNGGVLGKDLKLIVRGSNSDNATTIKEANDLIDNEDVVSLSLLNSARTLLVFEQVMNTKDVMNISPNSTSPEISTINDNNLVWRTTPSDVFTGKIAAKYVKSTLQISEIATLHINNTYGTGLVSEFKTYFESLGGTVLSEQSFDYLDSYDMYDFKPILDLLFANQPPLIYVITTGNEASKIFTQINIENYFTDDYKPIIMCAEGTKSSSLLVNSPTNIIDQMIGTAPSGLVNAEFESNFEAFIGHKPTIDATNNMYDAIYLMAYAMLASESADPNVFKTKMQEISKGGDIVGVNKFAEAKAKIEAGTDINYNGASGKIDFDENGDVTSGTYEIWKFDNGEFVTITTIDFP